MKNALRPMSKEQVAKVMRERSIHGEQTVPSSKIIYCAAKTDGNLRPVAASGFEQLTLQDAGVEKEANKFISRINTRRKLARVL